MTRSPDDERDRPRWERIEALFDAVYDMPPAERADALRAFDDTDIRDEVASLLAEEGSVPPIVGPALRRCTAMRPSVDRSSRAVPWPCRRNGPRASS